MKVALIQSNPVTAALAGNMRALTDAVLVAKKSGADLCIAPELALCGHNIGDMVLRSGFAEDCRKVLEAGAARLGADPSLPPLLLGAPVANPVPQGKRLQNCAVLLHKGEASVLSRKVLLPSGGIHDDARYFEPGVACGVFHHNGWRMAVTVGEDAWNDRVFWQGRRKFGLDPVEEFMKAGGADALLNLTALPFEQGMTGMHRRMLAHLAVRYRVPVLSVNMAGGNDSLVYSGGSLVFNDAGDLVARAPAFRESVLVAGISGKGGGQIAPELSSLEEIWEAVVVGTRDYARKCGFSGAVLGLSGGVDSALTAAIAAEALGPGNVVGVLMPSPFSSQGSIDDSLELAKNLGIATHSMPITPMLECYERSFSEVFPGAFSGIAKENTQARIRGSLLMAYSNRFNALLLTTGNKSESAVGYSTLYGDMAGGMGPIGDLYKRQVYELCGWYNENRPGRIPETILTKAPSAELAPGQKDEDSLPPYDVLDAILYQIIEKRQSAAQIVEQGFDEKMVKEVLRMWRRAEFKRNQAAPVLHLSSCGFGSGWRMPIAIGCCDQAL